MIMSIDSKCSRRFLAMFPQSLSQEPFVVRLPYLMVVFLYQLSHPYLCNNIISLDGSRLPP